MVKTNESKHTPGPYSLAGDNHVMATVGRNFRDVKRTVCIVTGWPGIDQEELEANKRLFASAPDLLRHRPADQKSAGLSVQHPMRQSVISGQEKFRQRCGLGLRSPS